MSIDFTVIFKLYILIIIIIIIIIITMMRKYYTLVQNGRQEGVGVGNQEVTSQMTFFRTAKGLLFSHIFYYYQGHFLSHYESLKYFTCIAVFIVKKVETFHIYCFFFFFFLLTLSYCFHPALLFPLQLPCLLQQSLTQICMYTFGCLDSTIPHTHSTQQTCKVFLLSQLSHMNT